MKSLAVFSFLLLFALQSADAQCLSGNCYTGIGTYLYPSGAKFSGHFSKGKINGYGRLVFSDGRIYEGEWKNHYRSGKGVMHFPKGDVYKGSFKKSKFYGFGTMEYANGDVFQGHWKADFPNGKGTLKYHNGDEYDGHFRAGKLHGQGTMKYANGEKYEGSWKANQKDGKGTFYMTNGEVIVGFWGGDEYVGEQPQVVSTANTHQNSENIENTSMLRNCNSNYCGSGRGKYKYTDGSMYVGEFSGGIPRGQGICYYASGDKYDGEWGIAGPNGHGTYYFQNGRVANGIWSDGRLVQTQDEITPIDIPDGSNIDYDPAVKLWAIVIGVSQYEYLHKLNYSDDDAYRFYGFLKSPEGGSIPENQVRVLVDEDATRKNILAAMNDVFGKADDNDIVMMYYSGHGIAGSFLPVDYNGFQNKLKHEEVMAILNASRAKHKICLADACYSGSLLAMKSAPSLIEDLAVKRRFYAAFDKSKGGTAILLSSQADEVSLEDQGLREGVYTHFLIRGLKGEADFDHDKVVEIDELYRFLSKNVHDYTAGVQTPVLKGKFDRTMPVGVLR